MTRDVVLQRGLRASGRLIGAVMLVVLFLGLLGAPFAFAVTDRSDVIALGLGAGLAVALGVVISRREGGGRAGVICGLVTAVVATLVGAGFLYAGVGVLMPPATAVAVASVDVFGNPMRGWWRSVLIGGAIGLGVGIGIGVGSQYGILAVLGGLFIGGIAGVIGASRRYPERTFFAGLRRPPLAALGLVVGLVVVVFVVLLYADRMTVPSAALGAVITAFIVPVVFYVGAHTLLMWLRDRMRIFRRLTPFFRVMWAPMSAFAIGYLAIIAIFAGFYGALDRLGRSQWPDDPLFVGAEAGPPSIVDWLFFAFFNATAQDYNAILPASDSARLLVGLQLVISVAWAVVVFAAVMASVQPEFEQVARGIRGSDDDPPPPSTAA